MKTWNELWRGTSTDGSHVDIIPNIASQRTWFRISDVSTPTVADTSLVVSKITRTLSIQNPTSSLFSIRPNPVSSVAEVTLGEGASVVQLFDVSGSRLYEGTARHTLSLDLSDFPSGVYSIRVTDRLGRGESAKIVVHH
jgi:hypothetical protein